MKLDLDEAPLTTFYVPLKGEEANLEILAKLKEMNVDILKAFTEESFLYYYDPNTVWRLNCDFNKIYSTLNDNEERFLHKEGLED